MIFPSLLSRYSIILEIRVFVIAKTCVSAAQVGLIFDMSLHSRDNVSSVQDDIAVFAKR